MIAIHAPLSLEELSFAANINKSISFARREFQKWVRGNFFEADLDAFGEGSTNEYLSSFFIPALFYGNVFFLK